MDYSVDLRMIQAKETYTKELIDSISEPDLRDIADRYGLELPLLRKIARQENWEDIRLYNRGKVIATIDETTKYELTQAGIDVGKVKAELLKQTYALLKEDLDLVHNELRLRLQSGALKGSELVSYLGLLLKTNNELQKQLEKTTEIKDEKEVEDFWDRLMEHPELIDIIRGEQSASEENIEELIEKDAERKKALTKFDKGR